MKKKLVSYYPIMSETPRRPPSLNVVTVVILKRSLKYSMPPNVFQYVKQTVFKGATNGDVVVLGHNIKQIIFAGVCIQILPSPK